MLPSSPHRTSPYRRQNLLIKRLTLTQRQRIHATLTASVSKPAFAATKTIASETITSTRKRPFANITDPVAVESPSTPQKIKSDPSVRDDRRNLHVRDGDPTNVEIIDENETWAEVSKIIPSLPYGEESNELLFALLGLDYCSVGGDGHHSVVTKTEGESISQSQSQSQYYALSKLARALERMLHIRKAINQGRLRNSNQSLKQKSIKEEHQQMMTEQTSTEILPWNVLLRITLRMVAFVANKLLQSSLSKTERCQKVSGVQSNESAFLSVNNMTVSSWTRSANNKCNNNSQLDIGGDDTRVQSSVLNSILQVMDIAITNLRVLSRMQSQQRQEAYSSKSTDETNDQTTLMAHKLQGQIIQRKQLLPIDRMFRDWKSHINVQSSVGRGVWGSSRYIFLKDIELIAKIMGHGVTIENDERAGGSRMGVDVEELNERVVILVTSLDECIRAEDGYHNEQNQLHQPQTECAISPSMLRKGTKICSPPKSPSMASITRTHVERVGSRIKLDMGSYKTGSILTLNSNVISINLQTVMDKESNIHSPTSEVADEMEEAYRMAMAVGSSRRGDNVRETIERRLEILVRKIKDVKNRDTNRDTGFNIGGAGSFLECLLSTLVQPSDPNIWMRLLEKSGGKETPIMLRRGRTLLVSFLIGIQAPGWKDASHRLEPSPVPSYLGYLSSRDDIEASTACESMKQHAMMNRSSYFLPAVERGQIILPPSPIVTEVGLSLCMKNFLHKGTPERLDDSSSNHPISSRSAGANLFRKYVPLHFSESSLDRLLVSIQTPLPHVNELTSDLFDLILRLAVNDNDIEQGDMSIPLRLATPSAVQSVSIVLQAVSDHLDWLLPISISSRYRFILQNIIQTFKCNELSSLRGQVKYDPFPDEDFASWSRRATFVVETAKVESRSRIALSTTKLMVLLCSRTNTKKQGISLHECSPYAGLQLRQSSHFWSEMDKDAVDIPSNIMARIFDFNFAERCILPLSYKCALLLAASSLPLQKNEKSSSTSQEFESLPSLVATLCSVLDVLAKHEVLHDCIHIGWSIQIFALSVSYFVFGEDFHWRERESKTLIDWDFTSDSIWEHLSHELNRLYCYVWGKDWQMCSRSPASTKRCIYYESIRRGSNGVAMLVLMPSFDVFVASLIEFSCGLNSPEASDGIKGFCQFIANIMFDRYTYVHQVCPPKKGYYEVDYPRQHELSLIISWIDTMSSMFQEMVCARSGSNVNKKYDTADEASTRTALNDLITPALRCLHTNIMRRVLLSSATRPEMNGDCSELVASGFVRLFKREAEKFLTKPSPAKTRKWNIYRKCLESVFAVTAPDVLFACPNHPALTEHAAETLTDIWNQYGEWNLSHSISIMVAASLHVGACASSPKRDSSLVRQDELLLQTKQLHTNFSSCAKSCIMSSLHTKSKSQSLDELRCNINYLVRFVKRELSLRGGTDIALEWWNEISVSVADLLKNHSSFHLK